MTSKTCEDSSQETTKRKETDKRNKEKNTGTWKGCLMRQQQNDADSQDRNFPAGVSNAVLSGSDPMLEIWRGCYATALLRWSPWSMKTRM